MKIKKSKQKNENFKKLNLLNWIKKEENLNKIISIDTKSLIYCTLNGYTSIVKILLKRYPNLEVKDNRNMTALMYSFLYNKIKIEKLLLNNGAKAFDIDSLIIMLNEASLFGITEKVKSILKNKAVKNKIELNSECLVIASRNGHYDIVSFLLQNGSNIESGDRFGNTSLSYAAMEGHLEIVKLLIKNKAYIDTIDEDNMTPFIYSCQNGHHEIAEILLQNFADLYARNIYGGTVSGYASQNKDVKMLEILKKYSK